ncbi:MAG TPA: class I SAM-dependent methyltransferase [Dictyobacter sp.]|nr:class I SAM-dependent methyltransferase [Dictyobacter sp.]
MGIVKSYIDSYMSKQYFRPSGLIGRRIGELMIQQHAPETCWTVELIAARPTDHILELSCGAGRGLELIAASVTEGLVVGLDFSRTMVASSRRRNAQAVRAGRVRVVYGKIEQLPFAEQSFDKVFGIHSLYFWTGPSSILRSILQVLKAGGTLTLTILPRELWPGEDSEQCRIYAGEQVVEMMLAAGFSSAHIDRGPEQKQFREIAVIGVK